MHLRDPAVAVGHDDVEPDHRRLGARREDLRRRRLPAEPRPVVVRVDLAVQPELEPGQLLPGRVQEPGDAVVPGDVGERVGVADVGGEQLGDAGLPRRRVSPAQPATPGDSDSTGTVPFSAKAPTTCCL
ncbi:hypothetical protein GCM10009772_42400 [Pseudonocardia alni subsp. carboxydivorans]